MKIRNGFVSNSSSSSFIVFIPENNKTSNNYHNIKKFFENNFGIDIESDNIGINDLTLEKIKDHINNGFGVVELDVEYDACESIGNIISTLCEDYFIYDI